MAMASFSRSMNGSPETSTIALAMVPPVKGNGLFVVGGDRLAWVLAHVQAFADQRSCPAGS